MWYICTVVHYLDITKGDLAVFDNVDESVRAYAKWVVRGR